MYDDLDMANRVVSTPFNSSLNHTNDFSYFKLCDNNCIGVLIWSGFSVAAFILGFPANLILLLELLRRRKEKTFNDLFLSNITVIELIFTVIMPFCTYNYMIWENPTMAFTFNAIYNLALGSRPLFMACICVDCYFAVLHPIIYMTNKTSDVIRKAASTTVWLIVACNGFYMAATPYAFTTPLFSMPFIIALPVITFCDVSILHALRKSDPSANNRIHPQKKRAIHAIVNSFVVTFLIYLPPVIIFLFGSMMLVNKNNYICILAMLGLCFSMAGCVIMPFLYLDTLGKLDVLKEYFKKCCHYSLH